MNEWPHAVSDRAYVNSSATYVIVSVLPGVVSWCCFVVCMHV